MPIDEREAMNDRPLRPAAARVQEILAEMGLATQVLEFAETTRTSAEAAAEEGARYADLGAAVVDIGGESTRPKGKTYGEGAPEILLESEFARVLPAVSCLRRKRPSSVTSNRRRRYRRLPCP